MCVVAIRALVHRMIGRLGTMIMPLSVFDVETRSTDHLRRLAEKISDRGAIYEYAVVQCRKIDVVSHERGGVRSREAAGSSPLCSSSTSAPSHVKAQHTPIAGMVDTHLTGHFGRAQSQRKWNETL
jgi:hypothetical protein